MGEATVSVAFAGIVMLLAVALGYAQPAAEPQMVWEEQVRSETRIAFYPEGVGFDCKACVFRNSLPAKAQKVRAELVKGEGKISFESQPFAANGFATATVLRPKGRKPQLFRIHFYWDPSPPVPPGKLKRTFDVITRGGPVGPPEAASLIWSGKVDDIARIRCRAATCVAETVRGRDLTEQRFGFSRALPTDYVELTLTVVTGRGEVNLVEQPDAANDFTAVVEIVDESSGAATYEFELSWGG